MTKFKQLQRQIKKVGKTEVEWGWINGKAYNKGDINKRGGIPYALIAITNEFGGYSKDMRTNKYVYIPSRPFFQTSVPKSEQSIKGDAREVFYRAVTGGDVRDLLNKIGLKQVQVLKDTINQGGMRPLHPKTVGIKGHGKQWYDSGAMVKNITHRVIYKRADYQE